MENLLEMATRILESEEGDAARVIQGYQELIYRVIDIWDDDSIRDEAAFDSLDYLVRELKASVPKREDA